jgi:alpha-2-macroglobulin
MQTELLISSIQGLQNPKNSIAELGVWITGKIDASKYWGQLCHKFSAKDSSMRMRILVSCVGALLLATSAAVSSSSPQVTLATSGSGSAQSGAINRFTLRFSESMVPLGDPRAVAPSKMECAVPSTGRWVDAQTWVAEFERPLPGGLKCKLSLNPGLKSARGAEVIGTSNFIIDTGGPAARAVLAGDGGDIEEDQVFLVATNTPALPKSIATAAYCAVDGIGEKIAVDVLGRDVASKLLNDLGQDNWDARNFLENAGLPQTVSTNASERANAL